MKSIAQSIPRVDGEEKSEGRSKYLADIEIPNVLVARFITADQAPARVARITPPEIPTGYHLITARDVPGLNGVHMIDESWPLFADPEVEFVGQPVALIAGPDPKVVADLIEGTEVAYDPAEDDDDITTFADYSLSYVRPASEPPGSDVQIESRSAGESSAPDPAASAPVSAPASASASAPASASASVGETHRTEALLTGAQEHVYLEPQGMAAQYDEGHLTVRGSMQCPFYVQTAVRILTGLPDENIRVIQTTTGGGFGGKEEFPSVLACAVAVGAMKTGRPVRMILDREEDIRISTKRHPSRIQFASTVTGEGLWAAADIDIGLDAGAYEGLSAVVLQRSLFAATGVYRVGSATVRARAYKTNVVPFGAFRGFGAPQASFAVELHATHLARLRGEIPLAFKRRHLLQQGDHTLTGGQLHYPNKLKEMIDRAAQMSDYYRRYREYEAATMERRGLEWKAADQPVAPDDAPRHPAAASAGAGLGAAGAGAGAGLGAAGAGAGAGLGTAGHSREVRGRGSTGTTGPATPLRGIGASVFSHGCGFTGSGEQDIIKGRVSLLRYADGSVEVRAANVEMGQGALTTLRKIVARTLDISMEQVSYHDPDTGVVPDSGPTVASRTAMVVGELIYRAAARLKDMPLPTESEAPQVVTEQYKQPDDIRWNQDTFQGDAYPAFSWGVNIIEVEVDPLTYMVRPTHVWAVYDVGEPLDQRIVEGQMHGGIVQALGWATSEVLEVRDGRFLQHNLTDYVVPGSRDIPPMDVECISNPYPLGPYGAKGAGELPFNGPAPALAAAVEQALGRFVYRIPLSPEYLESIDGAGEAQSPDQEFAALRPPLPGQDHSAGDRANHHQEHKP